MQKTIPLGTVEIFFQTLGRGLFFPVWWYSRGLVAVLRFAGGSLRNQYESLGLGVWLKNLLVPMYGINDLPGRIISFFIRLFMIIVRAIGLGLWFLILLVLVSFYLVLMPVSLLGFVYHLVGIFYV